MLKYFVGLVKSIYIVQRWYRKHGFLDYRSTPLRVKVYYWTAPDQSKTWRRVVSRLASRMRPWWAERFSAAIQYDRDIRRINPLAELGLEMMRLAEKNGPRPMKPNSRYMTALYEAETPKPPGK